MRAAQIAQLGQAPEVAEIDGGGAAEILAVALNPLDLAVAAGRFYGGHPPLPYVPGCEAVARLDGERAYLFGDGRGTAKDGFLAERVDFPSAHGIPVPEGIDDAVAVACGIAGLAGWLPVAARGKVKSDDRVLVLGATGTAGSVALQGARVLGAERVVAAGRDDQKLARARELGADETVSLDGDDLAQRFKEACGGDGPTLVVDPLWGEPARAAIEAAAPRARIVQLGQSAGPESTLSSAAIRGKQLEILGLTVFGLSVEDRGRAYRELTEHVAAGRISIEIEIFELGRIAEAWAAQASGRKAVVRL